MDSSPPGSFVYGILQARILEWVAIPFSRGPSQPRDGTQVFCIAGRLFNHLSHQGSCESNSVCVKNFLPLKRQYGFLCLEGAGGWGLLGEDQVRKPESQIYLVGKEQGCC